jgi:serine/threonine protein kinase
MDTRFGVGAILAQRYLLKEFLGSGGNGEVYLGEDQETGELLAVKIHAPRDSTSPESERRIMREYQMARSLIHPNLLVIHELKRDEDILFLLMEYCPGGTLRDYLDSCADTLSELDKIQLMLQIAQAIAHLHENGVLHRDIKTSNVLVTEDGTLKVSDFGLSRWQSNDMTQTKSIGTPIALAPELWNGEDSTPSSDIYALGALFYEILTNKPPFEGSTVAELANFHIFHTPKPPSNFQSVNPLLEFLIGSMLSKKRTNRVGSLKEIIFILEQAASGRQSLSLPQKASSTSSKQYAGLIAAVLALAVILYLIQVAKPLPALVRPQNGALSYFEVRSPNVLEATEYIRGYENGAETWVISRYQEKFEKTSPTEWVWSRTTASGEVPKLHLRLDQSNNINASLISGSLVGEISCGEDSCGPALVDDYLFMPDLPGDLPSAGSLPFAVWKSHESSLSIKEFVDNSRPVIEPILFPHLVEARKFDNWNLEWVSFFRWPLRGPNLDLVFPFGWESSYPGRPKLRFLHWPYEITNGRVPNLRMNLQSPPPKTTLVLRLYSDCHSLLPIYNEGNWRRCRLFQDIVFGKLPNGAAMGPVLTVEGSIDYFPHDRHTSTEMEYFTTIDKITLANAISGEDVATASVGKPNLPELFIYSTNPPADQTCISLTEPQDSTWEPISLCTQNDLGLRWSHKGPINGLICIRINEGDLTSPWQDNFICHPHSSPFTLLWSNHQQPLESLCYSLAGTRRKEWHENHLCVTN